jgi:hypothetical protein
MATVSVLPSPVCSSTSRIPAGLLALALGRKLEAEPLEPGEYHVRGRVIVAVDCIVTKAQPVSARQPFRCDLAAVLAVILQQAGVKPERVAGAVERAVLAAQEGEASREHLDATAAGLERASKAIIDTLPPVHRDGVTKVVGTAEILRFDSAA